MRVVHRTAAVPGQQHQTCEGAGHTHGAEDAFRVIDPVRLRDPRVIVMRAAIPLRHRGQGRTDAIDQRLVETLCGRIGHGPGPAEAVAQELGGVHQPGRLDTREARGCGELETLPGLGQPDALAPPACQAHTRVGVRAPDLFVNPLGLRCVPPGNLTNATPCLSAGSLPACREPQRLISVLQRRTYRNAPSLVPKPAYRLILGGIPTPPIDSLLLSRANVRTSARASVPGKGSGGTVSRSAFCVDSAVFGKRDEYCRSFCRKLAGNFLYRGMSPISHPFRRIR